jgi:3-oxoacyl-[acyl-carrier-protein] synthase II
LGERVAITGIGPVTPLGVGKEAAWEALSANRTRVVERELRVDLAEYERAALVPMPAEWHLEDMKDPTLLLSEECAEYRDLRYAVRAMRLAVEDAGLDLDREADRIGVIYAFEAPGMEAMVRHMLSMPPEALMVEQPRLYPFVSKHFYHTHSFFYVHVLGKAMGLHGMSTCVHNACASGAFAVEMAAQQIRSGAAPAMLVAGAEAFETGVRVRYLRGMETYAEGPEMRPFDVSPTGFYVGEGGTALVLEARSHADARGARIYAEYAGGGFAQQSWKHAMPDVPANRLAEASRKAMADAEVNSREVDLVVPHGAGSGISDGYEAYTLGQLFEKGSRAPMCPLKAYLGHQLGNCVLAELAAGLMMMEHGLVLGQPFGGETNGRVPLELVRANRQHSVRIMLKLATGFTGHDAAMVFRKA